MKNVTITLDEETARLVRVRAAERDMSVSRYIGELLRADIRASREYQEAYRAFLAEKPLKLRRNAADRYLTREEAHDRAGLRRR